MYIMYREEKITNVENIIIISNVSNQYYYV